MNLGKLSLITEILGSDFDPDDLHLSKIYYIAIQCFGVLFMTVSTVLYICSPMISAFLLIGSAIVYTVLLSINDKNDLSMLLIIPLSVLIGIIIIMSIRR